MKRLPCVAALACAASFLATPGASAEDPGQRAVGFLARESPRWIAENGCFSCHNNGDAARVLYLAVRLGYPVPTNSLSPNTAWLIRPQSWDDPGKDPAYDDKKLARIQFSAALAEAVAAGQVKDRRPLVVAAEALMADQEADGSWQVDAGAAAGSPVTYGAAVATWLCRRTLLVAGSERFAEAIDRASAWLRQLEPRSVPEAAAQLLALPNDAAVRGRSLALIRKTQASDGGWGPQAYAPAEPFDTALVVLALAETGPAPELQPLVQQGYDFLAARQLDSGGWPETTRPPGGRSYAQHVSTSAWAAQALLAAHRKGE